MELDEQEAPPSASKVRRARGTKRYWDDVKKKWIYLNPAYYMHDISLRYSVCTVLSPLCLLAALIDSRTVSIVCLLHCLSAL